MSGLKWELCYKKSRVLASARMPPLLVTPVTPSHPLCHDDRGEGGDGGNGGDGTDEGRIFGQNNFVQEMVLRFDLADLSRPICSCFSCYSIWDEHSRTVVSSWQLDLFSWLGHENEIIAVISKLSRLSSDAQPSRRRNVDECFGHMTCLATGGQLH